MRVIKRYPNRKLYDTKAKQYVTLERISALIQMGEEVKVLDHGTGADLTAVTLTQIISEKERRRRGFLPLSVLTGLIQAGGKTLTILREQLASPLELASHVDEEIERRLQALISQGDLAPEDGLRLRTKLSTRGHFPPLRSWPTDQQIAEALTRQDLPTPGDLQQLGEQLERLAEKLAAIHTSRRRD